MRRMLQDLAANRGIAMLIDQHLHTPDAVYVDYFGRPAATTSALAALALRTGAVVLPVFALPLPGGRYRLVYEHPVPPPAPDAPDAVQPHEARIFVERRLRERRDISTCDQLKLRLQPHALVGVTEEFCEVVGAAL